jgi:hypothetical protein
LKEKTIRKYARYIREKSNKPKNEQERKHNGNFLLLVVSVRLIACLLKKRSPSLLGSS